MADARIITVAGIPTQSGYSGDRGPATSAHLTYPIGLTIDLAGNLFISDSSHNVVRKVTPDGLIATVAGVSGQSDSTGDGGLATNAHIGDPFTLASDAAGNIYFSDFANSVVRKVSATGIISTIAGTGTSGYSGNGGPATSAAISYSYGITVDPAGNVYFSDMFNGYVRKIDTAGKISNIAGSGPNPGGFKMVYTGDGGPADKAMFGSAAGIYLGTDGSIYVADGSIRKISPTASLSFPSTNIGSVSAVQSAHLFNIGNQDQSMSALAVGTNFGLDPSSTCSASTPLTTAPTAVWRQWSSSQRRQVLSPVC